VRCAITAAGVATVDRTAPGRGAWVCSAACFELAMKRKAFERSWRRPLRRKRSTRFVRLSNAALTE
jgi:predicted RNA-binding protein YlxR (DUF448 family)